MNLIHHWTRYSVVLKGDGHEKWENGHLSGSLFPYLMFF